VRESSSRFGVFLRSYLSVASHEKKKKNKASRPGVCNRGGRGNPSPPRRAGGLFPCMPPIRAPDTPRPASSRRAARWARHRTIEDQLVLSLAAASFLSSGMSPKVPPSGFQSCSSASHKELVSSVRNRVAAYARLSKTAHVSEGSGRKGPLLADALANAHALAEGGAPLYGLKVPSSCEGTGIKFKSNCTVALRPLVADRLAYPPSAGTWNLGRHLYGAVKEAFERPSSILLEDPPFAPRAKVLGSKEQWFQFLEKADRGGGLAFLHPRDVPVNPADGSRMSAGFFAVAKNAEEDRTITNRIPQNSQEQALGLCGDLLAHGTTFADIVLGTDEDLRVSVFDMPQCYHRARVSAERVRTNAVGSLVPLDRFLGGRAVEGLRRWCAKNDVQFPRAAQPAFATLPMGDINAVDFVQVAHLNMLHRAGVVDAETLVRYRGSFPRGPVGVGVVVDDLAIVARIPRGRWTACTSTRGPDDDLIEAALAAYEADGVPPKPEKTSLREPVATVWGASVDGSSGRVGAGLELDFRMQLLVQRILESGYATRDTWDAVVGLVSYVFLYRRELFCILEKVYGQGRHCEADEIFKFSQQARIELELVLALGPLASHSMRLPVSDRVWATDASQYKAAATFTDVPPGAGERLWTHRAKRRRGRHLLTTCEQISAQLGIEDSDDDPDDKPPQKWTDDFAASRSWKPSFVYRTDPLEHINLKEARAVRTLVRRLARTPGALGRRHLNLLDSAVVLGGLTKGRSPSNPLNRILRSTVGDRVLGDIVLGFGHVSTKWNPADDPTRGEDVRKRPVFDSPPVLKRFVAGSSVTAAEEAEFFSDEFPLPPAVFGFPRDQ